MLGRDLSFVWIKFNIRWLRCNECDPVLCHHENGNYFRIHEFDIRVIFRLLVGDMVVCVFTVISRRYDIRSSLA